jgi:Hemerythrin HHE cation binding domain
MSEPTRTADSRHWPFAGPYKPEEIGAMELTARQVRKLILDEHSILRNEMADIGTLLEDIAAKRIEAAERLRHRLESFYDAFLKHISHEDSLLRPVLANIDAWGAVRVEKMDDEHRDQRASIAALVALDPNRDFEGYLSRVQAFVAAVGADMATEEQECLSPETLRDDTIVIDYFTG